MRPGNPSAQIVYHIIVRYRYNRCRVTTGVGIQHTGRECGCSKFFWTCLWLGFRDVDDGRLHIHVVGFKIGWKGSGKI